MIEKVKIKNSKGQNISAVIHRPDIKTKKLAILCPGFLDTKNYDHLILLSEELLKKGFTVVRFDPTGTWESEGDISEYLTSQYLNDVRSVLEYMLKEKNYSYILLGGHSRGGLISILYASLDSRISFVLGIMPSSIRIMIGTKREEWEKAGFSIAKRDIPKKNEEIEFKVPYSHVIDRDQFNVFEAVKKITVPLVMIAGELDKACLPEDVKKLFDQANEPKKFILMKNIGHEYRHNLLEIKEVNKEIINSLELP
ncbi:hypothetical protein A3C60_01285 [Candidatus Nomurabacteria bacterium RIFCSPHIGHO2_02_FULL_37_45]|uniref:Serine aminopeptidase S33 domain-containing protein n=2 Tax=Candidatus Nomuraibacteriota TaxID=1752729 RepID=A0A1F6Y6A7_9BACT|nr:MAG: hypothetical protein A2727_01950 [Candidatus Nomurabacteria bacterium RIFCSPHIGHO2_01_FULL_37_110]OGI71268.1 MAG: hypothetical protein A3C60_01285 [Candidatus Nomurabacteria bacterium RIFCSPHIGHO2_02_FULL_37_45]OGI79325.1 MAG: hypothetical protein A3F19_02410 [Candidatus Nomurabacteria bacterium RIFCSPHIGHO2_12_FULL_37_29]OGI84874.1 MAG: hypothetical protein A3A92_00920 [Candidatus Nomurabacteria bacterium RIFCSPLOWO2_01_FULL_37_49]OGJ01894.1 MAG: hypothetical protein A3G98_01200 [Candi